MACSVGKVRTCTLLMTVCSYIEHMRKTRRDKINTAELKSLEPSDTEPRVKESQGDPKRTRKTTRKPEEACGRYRSSLVHPDRFPPFLSQAWWYAFSASVLVETGLAQSRLFIIETFPHTVFCSSTHHEVLDCTAAAAFQKLRLGAACGTDCGAAAAFQKETFISTFTLIIF